MIVKDHLNMMGFAGNNPLQGPNDDRYFPSFLLSSTRRTVKRVALLHFVLLPYIYIYIHTLLYSLMEFYFIFYFFCDSCISLKSSVHGESALISFFDFIEKKRERRSGWKRDKTGRDDGWKKKIAVERRASEIHGVNGNEFESASSRQRLSGSFPEGKSSTTLADCELLDELDSSSSRPLRAKGWEADSRARSLRSSKE